MNSNSWLPLIFEVAKWERQEAVKHFLHSLESMLIVFFWQLMWTLTSRLMCGQMTFNSNIWPSGPMSSFCHQANQQVVTGPVLLERVNRKVGFRDSKTPLLREKRNLCFPASCGISLGWWWVLWNLRWNEPASPHSCVSLCLISVLFLANDYCPWHCLPLHTSLQDSGRVCHFPTRWPGVPLTGDAEVPVAGGSCDCSKVSVAWDAHPGKMMTIFLEFFCLCGFFLCVFILFGSLVNWLSTQ